MLVQLRRKLPNQRIVTIGSAADNDVIIDHPTVSRHHAIITRRGLLRRRKLDDLNSTNGTLVNGRRIDGPLALRSGDHVVIGAVAVSFSSDEADGALWPLLLASVLCCFLVGFASTEHLLSEYIEETNRPATASSPAITLRASEISSARSGGRLSYVVAKRVPSLGSEKVAAASGSKSPIPALVRTPEWLITLNHYRDMAKVAPLTENTNLDDAEVSHARYLVMNYSDYFRAGRIPGLRAMHSEDASKPWYTITGGIAAEQSDLYEGCGPAIAQTQTVNGWIEGPFHRVSLLSPNVRAAVFGSYQEAGGCWASGLRLIEGRKPNWNLPIEFPGDGTQISLNQMVADEAPDLLKSCPGYVLPAGLPISIELGYSVTPTVTRTSLTINGQPLEHCLVDSHNYENADPEAKAWGRGVLRSFGALFLVPRSPLRFGVYVVKIATNRTSYDWSFRVGYSDYSHQ